ncbi:hypothetical protein BDV97DRAFT_393253 [Delphinella strobiligena]|nr:hypothetical protein BDV97DRAFT_393253 [Delphinella strobiligena]
MTGILDLPPELTLNLASFLEREDLGSLRLTCKQLNQHFFDCWVEEGFAEICILPTAHALDRLHDLSKNDKIRRAVRCITIPGTIFRNIEPWDPWVDSVAFPCEAQPAEQVTTSVPFENRLYTWQRCVNEYVQQLRSGALGFMLRRALQAFSGIEISVLYEPSKREKDITVLGRSDLVKKTGLDPWRSDTGEEGWYIKEPMAETVIASNVLDICSSLSVTSLTLHSIEPCHMEALNMSHVEIERCFVGLRTLHIKLADVPGHANDEGLYKFLNALPNLEHLNFCISGYEHRPIALLCDVAVPFLVSLKLDSTYRSFRWSDLADLSGFLDYSAQTLRSLSLNNFEVDLEADERANTGVQKQVWAILLLQLQDEFSLEYLFIGGCNESQISILSIFGDVRESKHQQSAEVIKTQLGECIKHLVPNAPDWPSRE